MSNIMKMLTTLVVYSSILMLHILLTIEAEAICGNKKGIEYKNFIPLHHTTRKPARWPVFLLFVGIKLIT